MGADPIDGGADHIDELDVRKMLDDSVGHAGKVRVLGVCGRGLADRHVVGCRGGELSLVPSHSPAPVGRPREEVDFLDLRHEDLWVFPEVMEQARGSGLHRADDQEGR
jgi:hypothetical protein